MKKLLPNSKNLIECCLTYFFVTPVSKKLFLKLEKISQWFFYRIQLNLLLKKHRITLALDVGANTGDFAKKLSHYFRGKIISFEPVGSTYQQLIRKSANHNNWECHQIALGMENSHATIFVASNTLFSSMHSNNKASVDIFGEESLGKTLETITVKRFDTFASEQNTEMRNEKIFLKMDTQGHDLAVFKGLGKYLDQILVIQTEVSLIPLYENTPHWTETISTIENAGYRVIAMFPVNKHEDQVIEYDCIFEKTIKSNS